MAFSTAETIGNHTDFEFFYASNNITIMAAVAGRAEVSPLLPSKKRLHLAAQLLGMTLQERFMLPEDIPCAILEFIPIYSESIGATQAKEINKFAALTVEMMRFQKDVVSRRAMTKITSGTPNKKDLLESIYQPKGYESDYLPGYVFVMSPQDASTLSADPHQAQPGDVYGCTNGEFHQLVEPSAKIFKPGKIN